MAPDLRARAQSAVDERGRPYPRGGCGGGVVTHADGDAAGGGPVADGGRGSGPLLVHLGDLAAGLLRTSTLFKVWVPSG